MSLVKVPSHQLPICRTCGSNRVTSLSLILPDGLPVDFTSCHHCEETSWSSADGPLPLRAVLERSRKIA
jgi:hypothetical protein